MKAITSAAFVLAVLSTNAYAASCSDFTGLSWCEDFNANTYGNHLVTSSFGHLTHTHRPTGGYDNSGYAHFRINDASGQDSAGYGGVNSGAHNTRFNLGYLIRFGSNFGPPLSARLQKHKDLLLVPACWFSGNCPSGAARPMILGAGYCSNPDNCGATYGYRTWAPCSNAAAGCEFPIGESGWRGWPSSNEPFKIDERENQWIYVEFEVVIGGRTTLYIYTPDGALSGAYHSIATNPSQGNIGGIDVIMGVWEAVSGTTSETYYDLDLVRIDDRFMGPPPGFSQQGAPAAPPDETPMGVPADLFRIR